MTRARDEAAARRERAAAATRAYDAFLDEIAVPAFRQLATVLKAEGLHFEVQTPSGGVRLVSERGRDAIELELDTALDPPQPILVSSYARGSRTLRAEGPVKDGAAIHEISEDDLLERLIVELEPWLG